MVRTKQTAHGSSSTRPAGMREATIGDAPEVDQDILEKDWPDIYNPFGTATQQATQTTQASKSTGETGEDSKAVGIPPTDNPPGATQNPTQDPTTDPLPQPQQQLAPTGNPP